MLSLVQYYSLAAILYTGAWASPAILAKDIELTSNIEKRFPSFKIASFDLATSHVDNVLFNLTQQDTFGTTGIEKVGLEVTCVDCTTHGIVTVSTSGVDKDDSIIEDIKSFFENPLDTIVDAFTLNVKVDFENVGGHFDFDINATANATYSFPIFKTATPVGAAVSEDVSVGMVMFVDLVFSLGARVDLQAGFEFAFPEGAFITVDPLHGQIVDHGFTGGETKALPIIVKFGSATLKAALRVRLQAGTTVMLFGTGFDFELGITADLIEYQATISTTPACQLSITEGLDVNIGAFAHAVGGINFATFGASPAIVTTILEVPLPSLCLTRPAATTAHPVPTTVLGGGKGLSSVPGLPALSITLSASLPSVSKSTGPLTTSILAHLPSPTGNVSTPTNSSSEALFHLGVPTKIITASHSFASGIWYTQSAANNSNTVAAVITTSTVYATDLITVTSCASAVLHCPAALATEVIITSTKVLYTTVCPVGATLPTVLPTESSAAPVAFSKFSIASPTVALHLVSPLKFIPCATPLVETIYKPTFTNSVYTMPTATIFAVPYPDWNMTLAFVSSTNTLSNSLSTQPLQTKVVLAQVNHADLSATNAAQPTAPVKAFEVKKKIQTDASVRATATGVLPSATETLLPVTADATRMMRGSHGILVTLVVVLMVVS